MVDKTSKAEKKDESPKGSSSKVKSSKVNAGRILVTSALPYVNNIPHLGNLVCVLSADVFTRHMRLRGAEIISILGTDEYGTTAETRAIAEALTPRQLVNKYFKIHTDIYNWFNCKFDCYGRTTSKDNEEVTIDIFKKLDKNGYIVEQEIEQLYCKSCEKFLADRFVEGKCPKCGYDDARGDQCDDCGQLLNAVDLINSTCKVCKSAPEIRRTDHLFIDLPKLQPKLESWFNERKKSWANNAITMTEAWMRDGLKLRAISRDLKWGIKIPKKGFENKVFYSWFDAPIGYIGITKENKKDWKSWWHGDDVRLIQFMGKDNIPFHTIMFPSFLIGAKDDYVLLDTISSNEYLNFEGGKFSKSRSLGIFGDDAIETGIPADIWRYYIMAVRPEKTDSDFTWNDFQSKINNELVANLGNLVNRTLVFLNKFYDGVVPAGKPDEELWKGLNQKYNAVAAEFDSLRLKDALKEVFAAARLGNQYFQEQQPWKAFKADSEVDKKEADNAMFNLVNIVYDLAILIEPFMPETASSIVEQLNAKLGKWDNLGGMVVKIGHKVSQAKILVKKLEDKELEELKKEYSGKQKDAVENSSADAAKPDKFPFLIKAAVITQVEEVEGADKLYKMQVDVGEDEPRSLVAGLRPYYPADQLLNRKVAVLCNLEPAKIRGIQSNGMVLAVEGKREGQRIVELLQTALDPGELVQPRGVEVDESQINYKYFSANKIMAVNGKVFFHDDLLEGVNSVIDGKIV